MATSKGLPTRVIYLELIDSLLDADGGWGRAAFRLNRDFPWLFQEGWEIERWGLRRRTPGRSHRGANAVRGLTFPFPAFPRVLLPVVVWATQFVQSVLRPRAGIYLAYDPIKGIGATAARLLWRNSPVVVVRLISDFSARAHLLYGKRLESQVLQALERFVLARADIVLTIGPHTRKLAMQAGVAEERILELPNAPRGFGIEVPPVEREDPPHVAAAGRLVPEKGFDLLIAGFAEIADEFPGVLLDVAGDGPQRPNLESQATSLGIGDRVRFSGWLGSQSMLALYGGALAFVLPSRINEGFPTVLQEASLAGCALVGTDVGGIRDIVHPDRTGILVPPNDPEALADALRTLLKDPERAGRLGERAQTEARAQLVRRDEAVQRVRSRIDALRSARR
jgi:glycosyltransferase involved in cell wall biosynthesis